MEAVDVVVVGSGYGGSIPAYRLAEAGAKVVVLERGPRRETRDLVQTDDPVGITQSIDLVVSSSNIGFRTGTMMGGASINMDGAHFRTPTEGFAATDGTGRRYWPEGYDRATLDPFYADAERLLQVSLRTWSDVPKGGGLFAAMCDMAGHSCNLTPMNYVGCIQCGFCSVGCIFDRKMTLMHTYIPLAEAAGAVFRPGCRVTTVERNPEAAGWIVNYVEGDLAKTIAAPKVFVACGGIHTPALLLRSRLPGLSPHCGEHFNNNGEHTFIGVLPPDFGAEDGIDLAEFTCWKGMDNAGVMSFQLWDEQRMTLHPGGGFEPTVYASDISAADHAVLPARAWGLEYKRFIEHTYPSRLIGFSALGQATSHAAVTLRADGTPDIVPRPAPDWDRYLDALEAAVSDIGQKTGVTVVPTTPRRLAGTTSAHLLSSCRMSDAPEDGVVAPDGQVWGQEGLYVCDASAVPFALGVNPALTISAIAERVSRAVAARG